MQSKKTFTDDGLPPLGKQVGSVSTPHINLNHMPAGMKIGIFNTLKMEWQERASLLWESNSFDWSTEADIGHFVRLVLSDAIRSSGLNLQCHEELSIFDVRPDIWVVEQNGIPIGVVEIKRPGHDILDHPNVKGQIYDYMLRLRSFYGLKNVFGILSTYSEWRICWLNDCQPIAEATSIAEFKGGIPATTSLKQDFCADSNQSEPKELNIRPFQNDFFYGTEIIKWNNPELPQVLLSTLYKMSVSSVEPVALFSNDRPYILMSEDSWFWIRVNWNGLRAFPTNEMPSLTCENLILVRDLRGGRDGRVWLACSSSCRPCVIKFPKKFKAETTQTAINRLHQEHKHWKEFYPFFRSRIMRLGGSDGLILPAIPLVNSIDDKTRDAVRDEVRRLAILGFCHNDLKWEHVGYWNSKVVLIDLADVSLNEDPAIAEKKMLTSLNL